MMLDEMEIKKVLRTFHNDEESVNVVLLNNGDVVSDDEENDDYIGDINDSEIEDKIDEFGETWRETHWDKSDWADYYGCDEDEVDDAMDDDWRDFD